MNLKRIWLTLPIILLPYLFIAPFVLMLCFLGNNDALLFYYENILLIFGSIGAFFIITIVCAILCLAIGLSEKWDALSLAKTAMIIKLIHIPAYIFVFVMGIAFFFSIYLMFLIFILAFIDYVFLLTTTSLSLTSAINAAREGKYSIKSSLWFTILQFIFCADVITAVIYYFVLKKRSVQEVKNA